MLDDPALTGVSIVIDGQLSHAAVSLLCRLEHLIDQLQRPRTSQGRLASIQTAQAMLVEIIEFYLSTGAPEQSPDRNVISTVVEQIKLVELLLRDLTWSDMFGFKTELSRTKEQEYEKLGNDLATTFRELFRVLDCYIDDPSVACEWHEGWSIIADEFIAHW